jgi:hypothetical protein
MFKIEMLEDLKDKASSESMRREFDEFIKRMK